MPHPVYNLYHPFVNTHGGKRCDVCFGLREDQYHVTQARSEITVPAYPLQGPVAKGQATAADPTQLPAPQMQTRVP